MLIATEVGRVRLDEGGVLCPAFFMRGVSIFSIDASVTKVSYRFKPAVAISDSRSQTAAQSLAVAFRSFSATFG